jgi:pimeloyl-ACP methyl ester carboxylesterase
MISYPTFKQLATLLGGTYSASSMAVAEGIKWPPSPSILLSTMLLFHPKVISIAPPNEPGQPRTSVDPSYIAGPADLVDADAAPMDCKTTSTDGRVNSALRTAAQDRDGNKILQRVADLVAGNYVNPNSTPQDLITAITQLAVTGSSAYAAWSAAPTEDLTSYLTQKGMPAAAAATASQKIMADFNAALQAVRSPNAGIDETSLRKGMLNNWIAVSGEDDPPDYPVNVSITQYPQYHLPLTVATPQGVNSSIDINIRYIVASQGAANAPAKPSIPPGNEIVLFIHGEGSRAEEAADFIPALLSVGESVGRNFTVVAIDQPSCGYSTMAPHLSIAPAPPTSGGVLDTSSFAGSPILDFIENSIIAFVETLLIPFGNPIVAIVGGSLGGHMALRLAASQKNWVKNVIAWSPASVMDHTFPLLGANPPQRTIVDPQLAGKWSDGPSPPWPASQENAKSREGFFEQVWCDDTFDPTEIDAGAIAAAVVSDAAFLALLGPIGVVVGGVTATAVASELSKLPPVPPQPTLWYSDSWPSKLTYMAESRLDRREVYNTNFRQWHWRICQEMIGYTFDALVPSMNKPLLLLVGEEDNYPLVEFMKNVSAFAAGLKGPAQGGLTIQNTGHSIHNERPHFLASQVVNFASPA